MLFHFTDKTLRNIRRTPPFNIWNDYRNKLVTNHFLVTCGGLSKIIKSHSQFELLWNLFFFLSEKWKKRTRFVGLFNWTGWCFCKCCVAWAHTRLIGKDLHWEQSHQRVSDRPLVYVLHLSFLIISFSSKINYSTC